jgi:hypothetical protein
VDNAERGVGFVAEHAALASVGEGKLAERRFFRGDSGAGTFCVFHWDLVKVICELVTRG